MEPPWRCEAIRRTPVIVRLRTAQQEQADINNSAGRGCRRTRRLGQAGPFTCCEGALSGQGFGSNRTEAVSSPKAYSNSIDTRA